MFGSPHTIKPMGHAGGASARPEAEHLSESEASDLKAIALALPDTWCALVEAPSGQLALAPLEGRARRTYAWCASRAAGMIFRGHGRLAPMNRSW